MKKKLHCKNCGTVVKEDEKACSVCRMLIEREIIEETEEEKEFQLKTEFPLGKIIMIGFILIGLVLAIKGIVEYQNIEYCTADDCGLKPLFIAGLGLIIIISASIALAKDKKKYK
jgi:hypothetical protein